MRSQPSESTPIDASISSLTEKAINALAECTDDFVATAKIAAQLAPFLALVPFASGCNNPKEAQSPNATPAPAASSVHKPFVTPKTQTSGVVYQAECFKACKEPSVGNVSIFDKLAKCEPSPMIMQNGVLAREYRCNDGGYVVTKECARDWIVLPSGEPYCTTGGIHTVYQK